MSGLKLAALYSFPAHELGFCGPKEKKTAKRLSNYLSGKKISEKEIRKILQDFKGAYSYYKLIAKSNNLLDPFDKRVVKAYWIGNKFLEKVKIDDLRQLITKDFSKLEKAKKIPENSKPHHNFHVLIVGPVTKKVVLKGRLLDFCKISWGKIRSFKGNRIKVEYQPLSGEKKLRLGKPIKKEILWDKNLLSKIKRGDWISFHWNRAMEKLQKKDVKNLKKYTKITLELLTEMKGRQIF
ncbi:hypothetical protein AMJ49_01970 [Parcubacteria bacterium DG_74_2]|nr:MAG: hypothetical protein AMJ49_01970 [Parcubacteria bacterium DG_74_2]